MIVQASTLETTKVTNHSPRQKRGFGEYNLWELWLLDKAEEIPCGSIRTFLHYLCSEGTTHYEIYKASPLATGSVDMRLRGPVADDERNHLLRYRLTRGNVGRLKEAEKDLLVSGLMKHCSPTEDDKPNQEVRQALTALGLSFR